MDATKSVKELLIEAGLSQAEVCNRTGIKKSTLSLWVNGQRKKVPATAYAAIYNECEREILRKGKA